MVVGKQDFSYGVETILILNSLDLDSYLARHHDFWIGKMFDKVNKTRNIGICRSNNYLNYAVTDVGIFSHHDVGIFFVFGF